MFRNGLGPNNEGPMTGRGMGNFGIGEVTDDFGSFGRGCRGNGRGRRCNSARGAGFNRGFRRVESNNKELLEERKALLKKELEKINEQLEKA